MTRLTDVTAELTELPAKDDLIYVVDVSDTTDNAAGSSKKLQRKYLPGPQLIEHISADGTTITSFDFQSIPSDYRRLILKGWIEGQSTGFENVKIWFNNDTTESNYYLTKWYLTNSTIGAQELTSATIFAVGGTSQVSPTVVNAVIEAYADTNVHANADGMSNCYATGGGNIQANRHYVWHDSLTSVINRVTIIGDSDNLAGELSLYGEL